MIFLNKFIHKKLMVNDNVKIEKNSNKKDKRPKKLRRLSNGYLIDLPSPQFNICRGIYHRMDQVYPA